MAEHRESTGRCSAPAPPRAVLAWWSDPVLAVLFALAIITAVWCTAGSGPRPVQGVTHWVVLGGVQVTEIWLCLAVARIPGVAPFVRRFWRLLAAAAVMFVAGSVVQVVLAVRDPYANSVIIGGNAQSALLAIGALLLIIAMLTAPLGLHTAGERFRFCLDAATVMIAVAIFAWYLTDIEGSARAGGSLLASGWVNALVGPAAFLVVVFGVVKLVLCGKAPFTPLAGLFGGTAAALEGVGKGLSGPLLATDQVALLFEVLILANLAFVVGIRLQQMQMRTNATVLQPRRRRPFSRLPYASIAATYGLLVWVLARHELTTQAWVILGGAITSSALVVIRQLAAFADNAELVTRLDAKVRELAEAQQVLHRALDERDLLAAQLQHQAHHDDLTGLANRALFTERLADALARSRRTADRVTVMILDLDDFKPVNDRFGHAAGDTLLRAVADRLTSCLREVDTIARLGGDEFAVMLERVPADDVPVLLGHIAEAVCRPVRLGAGDEVVVHASIGVATDEGGSRDVTAVLLEADLAMYAQKRLHRSGVASVR